MAEQQDTWSTTSLDTWSTTFLDTWITTSLNKYNEEEAEDIAKRIRQSIRSNVLKKENLTPIQGWDKPRLFIKADANGKFTVDEEIEKDLSKLQTELVVIGVVGPYRTGKSALLNMLIGKDSQTGFGVSNSVSSKTRGIWIWCYNHPIRDNTTLIFIDTEGFGDVARPNSKNDHKIFVLTLLLSSTLLYNSIGVLNSEAFDKIKIVADLAQQIQIRSKNQRSPDVDEELLYDICPKFMWILRDFQLDLEGKTADQYFEGALQLKKGWGKEIREYNSVRECIKMYFRGRKCFTLSPHVTEFPQGKKGTSYNKQFVADVHELRKFVMENSETKSVLQAMFDGRVFGRIARIYCNTLTEDGTPCVINALGELLGDINGRALTEAKDIFDSDLKSEKDFDACAKKALEYMVKNEHYNVEFLIELMSHMMKTAKIKTPESKGNLTTAYPKGSIHEADRWMMMTQMYNLTQVHHQGFLEKVLKDQREFMSDMQEKYEKKSRHFKREQELAQENSHEQRCKELEDMLNDVHLEHQSQKEDYQQLIKSLEKARKISLPRHSVLPPIQEKSIRNQSKAPVKKSAKSAYKKR